MIERQPIERWVPTQLRAAVAVVRAVVEGVAFWSAIVLPFLHIPLLATGLETPPQRLAYVTLLALNAAAFVVGHGHASNSLPAHR